MDILEFFTNFSSLRDDKRFTTVFVGASYEPLFFEKLVLYIEEKLKEPLKKISVEQDLAEVQIQLSTTFLGQQYWYVIGNLEQCVSMKKKEAFIGFIKSYKGPHRLLAFIPSDQNIIFSSDVIVCQLQPFYTYDQIKKIPLLYDSDNLEKTAYFFNKLYRYKKEYTLDQLFLFKEYANVLGKNMDVFFQDWLEQLIVSDISLFYLSQLFFEKNAAAFFVKFNQIRSYYSDQFWTTFFSEQLFKAYFYVQNDGQIPSDQKTLQFGLPFSFLKQDWKLYSPYELQYAHSKIYQIDLLLKQGGSSYFLEAFLVNFFKGVFS